MKSHRFRQGKIAQLQRENCPVPGLQAASKWQQSAAIVLKEPAGINSVIRSRLTALLVGATGAFVVLQPSHAHAQWWSRTPADFEACADVAEKAPTKEEKTAALAECNAKFAGRRKPGGGYSYYDFMQDRTFDIAGPNPTPEEQKKIDEQYAIYLESQRRNNIVAAFAAKQQQVQQVQTVSLRSESERVPLPTRRPKVVNCVKNSFSCEWPRLSESLNELKKKLFSSSSSKAKRS
jgi:hypothetical protein